MTESIALHNSALVIDGLVISNWSREIFEDMHKGGLTAANCTCSVWEGFRATVDNIARWKRWLRENEDILTQVYTTADIERELSRRLELFPKGGLILGPSHAIQAGSPIENVLTLYRGAGSLMEDVPDWVHDIAGEEGDEISLSKLF